MHQLKLEGLKANLNVDKVRCTQQSWRPFIVTGSIQIEVFPTDSCGKELDLSLHWEFFNIN